MAGRSRQVTRTGAQQQRARRLEGVRDEVERMGVVEIVSCGVGGGRAAQRQVVRGGLPAEVLDAPHGSSVAHRTAKVIVAGRLEKC